MNVEIGTEAEQFPEKKYINGIFIAVHSDAYLQINGTKDQRTCINRTFIKVVIIYSKIKKKLCNYEF